MQFPTVLYELREGILTITLNRPDMLNAFNEQLTSDLQAAFDAAAADPAVRCIVLTGAGRAFCSGQDLKEISEDPDRSLADSLERRYNPLIRRIREIPKPVIAAINGACAGAGMSLALACDLRFASDRAKMIQVFVRIGLVPDSGSSFFLPRLVGYARAFDLCTSGREVSAAEALEMGLVNRVVIPDLLMEYATSVARKYAAAPTLAIGRWLRIWKPRCSWKPPCRNSPGTAATTGRGNRRSSKNAHRGSKENRGARRTDAGGAPEPSESGYGTIDKRNNHFHKRNTP